MVIVFPFTFEEELETISMYDKRCNEALLTSYSSLAILLIKEMSDMPFVFALLRGPGDAVYGL